VPGRALRAAYALYRTDRRRDTYLALIIVASVLLWVEYQSGIGRRLYRARRGES
jgi:hypothetical protein